MQNLISILVLTILGESIWETLKMTWQDGKINIDRIGALVVGLLLSFATGFNLLELVGITVQYQFVGLLCTGIIISRGANFVHDLLGNVDKLTARKDK